MQYFLKWDLIWNSLVYTTVKGVGWRNKNGKENDVWGALRFSCGSQLKDSDIVEDLWHLRVPWKQFFLSIKYI